MIRERHKYSYLASESIGCAMKVLGPIFQHQTNQKNHSSDIIFLSMTLSMATTSLDCINYNTDSTWIVVNGGKVDSFLTHVRSDVSTNGLVSKY